MSKFSTKGLQVPDGEPHPQDDGYVVPLSTVKLPSRGLIYPPENPLYLAESVDVKSMTAREEDILSSPALIKKGTVISTLMKACITNRTIDPDKMLGGDRNAILITIRVSAYGPEYNARVKCPSCDEEQDTVFNLSKLPMKMLEEQPLDGPGTNAFSFVLPSSQRAVRFKLMTADEVTRLEHEAELARKAKGALVAEQGVTMRLRAQILSIEGVTQEKLPAAISNMPARDSRALRKRMDDLAPGVDMVQSFECEACGKATEVDVPLGTEFFWPTGG